MLVLEIDKSVKLCATIWKCLLVYFRLPFSRKNNKTIKTTIWKQNNIFIDLILETQAQTLSLSP